MTQDEPIRPVGREDDWPARIKDEQQLEELLSRPSADVVELFTRLRGTLAVIGAGGKIGPSLTGMACRARDAAGGDREIVAVDLVPDPAVRARLDRAGARTIACDLLSPQAAADLPDARNVIYMVGMKFGTSGEPSRTWAVNTLPTDYVARRFRDARIVAFSTGCVYDLVPAESGGSVETDPLEPRGEYSNACVARERIFEHVSGLHGTPMVLMRLNYAVEMRYGVLADLASAVLAGDPVDLAMGYFNVIWQGDASAAALRLLEHAASPPRAINVTGRERLSIREVARRFGELTGREVRLAGAEADTALLSNAAQAHRLLGPPGTPTDRVIEWTADWLLRGRPTLGKPTHFQTRDGRY